MKGGRKVNARYALPCLFCKVFSVFSAFIHWSFGFWYFGCYFLFPDILFCIFFFQYDIIPYTSLPTFLLSIAFLNPHWISLIWGWHFLANTPANTVIGAWLISKGKMKHLIMKFLDCIMNIFEKPETTSFPEGG